jgi:hypothetical protein
MHMSGCHTQVTYAEIDVHRFSCLTCLCYKACFTVQSNKQSLLLLLIAFSTVHVGDAGSAAQQDLCLSTTDTLQHIYTTDRHLLLQKIRHSLIALISAKNE